MKSLILLMTVVFGVALPAVADQSEKPQCLFGKYISSVVESGWLKGEKTVSVYKAFEEKKLSKVDIFAMQLMTGLLDPDQAVNEFADVGNDGSNAGTISYYNDPARGDRYVYVWAYPGDNVAGYIYQLRGNDTAGDPTRLNVVAQISDGDIVHCRIFKR